MRFHTYTRYSGHWLDALNLENLMEHLADSLLDGGFAGGPHFHPYWGGPAWRTLLLGRPEGGPDPGPCGERGADA
jgi:hypothetical protein